MKMKVSTIILAFTALVFNVQADSSTLPAPMPQFMNKEQLVKWNAEQAATYKPVAMEEEPPLMFFTGKPYIPDAGGYVYKYRTYNPEMLRWTSADPSGFPDGVNNQIYCGSPTMGLDSDGLNYSLFVDQDTWDQTSSGNATVTIGGASYHAGVEAKLTTTANLVGTGPNTNSSVMVQGTGYTYLYTTGSASNIDVSETADTWSVSLNPNSGAITVKEISVNGQTQTNSDGTPPLFNAATTTLTGNGTNSVTIRWNIAASGEAVASQFALMTFTASE